MKKWVKSFKMGEKGFTLIELLVVIAILGVLAAVMVPNVGKFIGSGTEQAANTESHNVRTAVMAAMADENAAGLTDAGTVGPGHTSSVTSSGGQILTIESYFTGNLEATYTLDTTGAIGDATPVADGKWKDLTWNTGTGKWE